MLLSNYKNILTDIQDMKVKFSLKKSYDCCPFCKKIQPSGREKCIQCMHSMLDCESYASNRLQAIKMQKELVDREADKIINNIKSEFLVDETDFLIGDRADLCAFFAIRNEEQKEEDKLIKDLFIKLGVMTTFGFIIFSGRDIPQRYRREPEWLNTLLTPVLYVFIIIYLLVLLNLIGSYYIEKAERKRRTICTETVMFRAPNLFLGNECIKIDVIHRIRVMKTKLVSNNYIVFEVWHGEMPSVNRVKVKDCVAAYDMISVFEELHRTYEIPFVVSVESGYSFNQQIIKSKVQKYRHMSNPKRSTSKKKHK